MKKVYCLFVILILTLLCGCGTDPVAQKVMDDIESIGEVEISDKEKIEDISETYKELTEKQKNQVKNYADLLEAQDKIKELEDAAIKEMLSKPEYAAAVEASQFLKNTLYNPDSFRITYIGYNTFVYDSIEDSKGTFLLKIEYTGENALGGTAIATKIFEIFDYKIENVYGKGDEKYPKYSAATEYPFIHPYIEIDESFVESQLE